MLLGLGGVALVVGGVGVGIANVMVISVLERRSEIGLRRALGATRGHIRAQVLAESLLLSGLGGIAGSTLGVTRPRMGCAVPRPRNSIPPVSSWWSCGAPERSPLCSIIEFGFISVLVFIPLTYLIVAFGAVQRGIFAATEAAREAGRAIGSAPDPELGMVRAQRAAELAVEAQAVDLQDLRVGYAPAGSGCEAAGSYIPGLFPGEEFIVCVTVTVRVPLLPEFIEANTRTRPPRRLSLRSTRWPFPASRGGARRVRVHRPVRQPEPHSYNSYRTPTSRAASPRSPKST